MSATRLLLLFWLAMPQFVCGAAEPNPVASKSPHIYLNPLLADIEMADPDGIRVDDKYYRYVATRDSDQPAPEANHR